MPLPPTRSALALLAACALALALLGAPGGSAAAETRRPAPPLPATIDGGAWPTSHVQGIAVDRSQGVVYWSFTQVLVKTDLRGRVLGTVEA